MKLTRVLTCLVLILAVLGTAAGQAKPKQYVLRFNHVLSPQDPYHGAFLKWAEAVSQRTNGNLKVEVYHSAQLGVEEDILEQIRQGANIGQNTDAARLGNYVPDMAVMNAPYFLDNLVDVQKLAYTPSFEAWKAELERTQGFKILSFFYVQGFRQMIANVPIRRPEDLKGLRVRTPPAPIWQESIRALGATPVAMAYGDMYPALQTKALDGAELSATAAYNQKLFEVTKYLSETKHILLINFEVISSAWFNSLPPEYQRILEEECNKAGLAVSADYLNNLDVQNTKTLVSRGMTIVPASEIDLAAFKAAGEAAYRKLNLLKARDKVYQELGKKK